MGTTCIAHDNLSTPSTHAAEISGWDADGHFFVETTELDAAHSGDISAILHRCIADGALVFVRSVDPRGEDTVRGLPIAHEVCASNTCDGGGHYRIHFTPCRPHPVRRHGDQKYSSRI